jgi:disulfide bond formation protein DsbB
MTALSPAGERLLAALNYVFMLSMLAVLSGILIAAMTFHYAWDEIPCPLCLLQRVAMIGVCFGILQNLRGPFSCQNTGISLLFALFLLIVSARQTLLDIDPRPDHEYVGSAVLGLHMPVWSVVIALCILAAFALKLAVLGGDTHLRNHPASSFPAIARAGRILGLAIATICAINLASVVVKCGFGQCQTTGYALLKSL